MLRTPHNWRKNHFNREASFNNLTPKSKAYVSPSQRDLLVKNTSKVYFQPTITELTEFSYRALCTVLLSLLLDTCILNLS